MSEPTTLIGFTDAERAELRRRLMDGPGRPNAALHSVLRVNIPMTKDDVALWVGYAVLHGLHNITSEPMDFEQTSDVVQKAVLHAIQKAPRP